MVEREPAGRGAAVRATPAVAREQGAPRDLALHRTRHAHVRDQPDHMRPCERVGRGVELLLEGLDHLRLPLEHQDMRAPNRRDVQGFVAGIQDKNVLHLGGNVAASPP
jgi:hypothetical protein